MRNVQGWATAAAAACCLAATTASAQLVVTELMVDTLGSNEDNWEWIEVRNTGALPIDLQGYIGDRLNDPERVAVSIDPVLSTTTVIPAGGVAVIYDGDSAINAADYDNAKFRAAWGLAPTVPLIAATNWPALTNGAGTAVGFWKDATEYQLDVVEDDMMNRRVGMFDHAAFSIDFRSTIDSVPTGFPTSSNGASIAWNGTGSNQDGNQWAVSVDGTGGAVTSTAVTIPGSTNNVADVGNPGKLPSGTAPAGFWITEIMFNPASDETTIVGGWEWVEVFNNTTQAVDFGAMPGVIDDDDDGAKSAANLTSGVIPAGGVAIIYNGFAQSLSDMQAAWDPTGTGGPGGTPINFIGTTGATSGAAWTGGLANGGDRVGIWETLADYTSEAVTSGTGAGRTMANALNSIGYDDDSPTGGTNTVNGVQFPGDGGSLSLTGLSSVSNNATTATDMANWVESLTGDGQESVNAAAIPGSVTIHPGGDVGSPGTFSALTPTNDANFDNVNGVDGADMLIWQRNFATASGATNAQGDANGDGDVDAGDLAAWVTAFGTPATAAAGAIPEPSTLALAALAVAAGRRRRR